jgi:hypothetical protein
LTKTVLENEFSEAAFGEQIYSQSTEQQNPEWLESQSQKLLQSDSQEKKQIIVTPLRIIIISNESFLRRFPKQ